MSNDKRQIPDNKQRVTVHPTRFTSTDNGHGHEIRTLSEGEFAQQPNVWRGATFPEVSGHITIAEAKGHLIPITK